MVATPSPRTSELMAAIADRVGPAVDEIVREMDAAAIRAVPALGVDAAIAGELSASNRGNLLRFLAIAKRADDPLPQDVPPEALDIARTLVRRGIEADAIFQAYRSGQRVALERWTASAAEIVAPAELMPVVHLSLGVVFDYVDEALQQVLAEAQREREAVLGGALARRMETVRLVLDGAPIDEARASRRLGYELARSHTALVLWAEPPGAPEGALESTALELARAAGARRPLTLPAGTNALWAWVGTDDEPSVEALRDGIAPAEPNLRAAVGPTHRGIAGFRRSHEAALSMHGLLAAGPGDERLSTYEELEVTTLAAQDRQRATEFVVATLGPLAENNPTASRLRETLRVFLEEGEHAPRTAARLHTHRNTVLQRVARATQMLGHRPAERRLALELALELRRRLGIRAPGA